MLTLLHMCAQLTLPALTLFLPLLPTPAPHEDLG